MFCYRYSSISLFIGPFHSVQLMKDESLVRIPRKEMAVVTDKDYHINNTTRLSVEQFITRNDWQITAVVGPFHYYDQYPM